ncbi:DNA-directed RNA polymerase I subunit RPA34.5-domain-containing protein [Usnea florida]
MADPKQSSSLPVKKRRSRAKTRTTAVKPARSAEFVVDSDDSGDASTPTVKKPGSEAARSKPDLATPEAPKASNKQVKASKERKSPSPSPVEDDSSDSGSESDSSSDDEKLSSKKMQVEAQDGSPTPRPKSAAARPASATPSIKPSTTAKPLNQKNGRTSIAASKNSKSEAEGSSEDSIGESESASGSESESGSSDKTSLQSPTKSSPPQKSPPRRPTPAYEPPAGFNPTSISLHPASKFSEILAPSNLQGKQIWHITAPDTVPISLVKEVSTENIGNGASVLEYRGAKYGLVPESDAEQASSRALLLPSTQTDDYRPSKTTIIKTLHLQQVLSLPKNALAPAVHPKGLASEPEPYKKTLRPQPEGLRMRYRPFGVSDDSDLDSACEPMPKAPEFRMPAPVKETSPSKKRKRHESNDGSSKQDSAVKSKKRKPSPQASAGAIENPIDIDALSDERSNGTESPIKTSSRQVDGVTSSSNLTNGHETKEERRRRKKEKKHPQQPPPSKPLTALPPDLQQTADTIQPGEVIQGAAPAIANALEGTNPMNAISPKKDLPKTDDEHDKAHRRKEKRKRKQKEIEKEKEMPSTKNIELTDSSRQHMLQEIETAQRGADIPVSIKGDEGKRRGEKREGKGERGAGVGGVEGEERRRKKEEKKKRRRGA